MLYAEVASEMAARRSVAPDEDPTGKAFLPSYTPGRFGQVVYSTIRRFVVVQAKPKQDFVYAW